jgi:phage baseplate assembly protein V
MIDFEKLLRPITTRISNLVSRAVVALVDDSKRIQDVQLSVLKGETREGVERFQEYGFTSVPHPGAEAVVLFPGGSRDHGLCVAVDDRRYRLKGLEDGEVAIYTDEGDKITIKRGGMIEISCATKAIIKAPLIDLTSPTTDAEVRGTTYREAEDIMLGTTGAGFTALATALGVAGGALSSAGADPVLAALAPSAATSIASAGAALTGAAAAQTAAASGVTGFTAGAATYLSTKVRLS